jgi:hypothetical protein
MLVHTQMTAPIFLQRTSILSMTLKLFKTVHYKVASKCSVY